MAVGGMIGGGIFSVLGTSIDLAGNLAFASFILGGIIALLTAKSYTLLTLESKKSGGPFTYLTKLGYKKTGAITSWLLIFGYILALAVYAFTFGHYAANLLNSSEILARALSVLVIAIFFAINIRGVSTSAITENIIVFIKVAILGIVSIIGFLHFTEARFTPLSNSGYLSIFLAATSIFIAFEGFELLPYDYDDIENPQKNLPKAMYTSVIIVTLIYVVVTLGSQMLVSNSLIASQNETAFIAIGQEALGVFGKILAVIAALLATSSAVNATLFSTARQIHDIAKAGELPRIFSKDKNGLPKNAIGMLAGLGVVFSLLPNVITLLTFGSMVFLFIFAIVNFLSISVATKFRDKTFATIGFLGCFASLVALIIELITNDHSTLMLVLACFVAIGILRLVFVKRFKPRAS
jgi:amino acid transporter